MHGDQKGKTLFRRGPAALELAKQFNIIPIKNNEKVPAVVDWPNKATMDSAIITKYWMRADYNIGIVGGRTRRIIQGAEVWHYLVILDYDCKPGQRGAEMLAQHEMLGLSDTLTSETSYGIHKLYWSLVPIGNSVSRIAPNVDVRGVHGYVLAPPSSVNNRVYKWRPEFYEPEPYPDMFLALTTEITRTVHQIKLPVGELDTSACYARVKLYLINDAPEAVQGHHGDATTFQVAARVKDLGMSEEACLEIMLEIWNPTKAHPPWAFDALRTKVANAYMYGANPPGIDDPANQFEFTTEPIKPKPIPKRTGMYRISYRNSAKEVGMTRGQPLIKNLFNRNTLIVLYGPSNSGKTFVSLDIAFAIGAGVPWNGLPTSKGLVVYVAAEGGPGINARTAALDQVRKPTSDPLFDVVPCPVDLLRGHGPDSHTGQLITLIREAEQEHGTPCALVVIDTLSRALAGGDENSSVDMGTFIKHIDMIRAGTGAAVLIIHHSGKNLARGARGWSGIQAAIDTEVEINENVFSVMKQRDLVILDEIEFTLTTVEVAKDQDGDPITSCVVDWGAAAQFDVELTENEIKWLATIKEYMTKHDTPTATAKLLVEFSDSGLSKEEKVKRQDAWGERLKTLKSKKYLKGNGSSGWQLM